MHRFMAVLIVALLGAAVVVAVVRGPRNAAQPLVLPTTTPAPKQTYTYFGLPPTAPPSETPIIPQASHSVKADHLAGTGAGSMTSLAVIILAIAGAGAVAIRRADRKS